jgi:hypothetical protein
LLVVRVVLFAGLEICQDDVGIVDAKEIDTTREAEILSGHLMLGMGA